MARNTPLTPLSALKKKIASQREVAEYNKLKYQDREYVPSRSRRVSSGVYQAFQGITNFRRRQAIAARDLQRPLIGQGRGKKVGGGRGRPRGPSGRYVIPGVGPVGVYEYRLWLRSQLRNKRMAIQQQVERNRLSPGQIQALAAYQARQNQTYDDPENKVIPDTRGNIPMRSIHEEIDAFASDLPRGIATRAGSEATIRNIARTFKLVESGYTEEPDIQFTPNNNIFRNYRVVKGRPVQQNNIFIQRQRRSIISPGEKAQLAEARRQAKILRSIY